QISEAIVNTGKPKVKNSRMAVLPGFWECKRILVRRTTQPVEAISDPERGAFVCMASFVMFVNKRRFFQPKNKILSTTSFRSAETASTLNDCARSWRGPAILAGAQSLRARCPLRAAAATNGRAKSQAKPSAFPSVRSNLKPCEAMRQAVSNRRELSKTIEQMERVSRQLLFQTTADTCRRKPLGKKL